MQPYFEQDGIVIYHGDCRDVAPSLDTVDLVLTDPPYGIGFAAHPAKSMRGANVQATDWDNAVVDMELLNLVRAKGKTQVIWGGNYYPLPISRGWLAWVKPAALPTFGTLELAWTNLDQRAQHIVHNMVHSQEARAGHPTQKPLTIIQWCFTVVPECATVLDPFMGSGTTLVAAKSLGKHAIGIEIEEKYCEMAARRLDEVGAWKPAQQTYFGRKGYNEARIPLSEHE